MAVAVGPDVTLFEREPLLEQLRAALEEASAGQGRLVLVGGEAGVGKTTVVRRFSDEQGPDLAIAWGACDALFTPRPLAPFLDLAADWGGELLAAVAGGGPHEVASALVRPDARRPEVVVLEDVHWADEATLDALRLIARRIEHAGVLVVATFRDDELDRAHPLRAVLGELATRPGVQRVRVEPLSPAAVVALATDTGVDASELHRKTGGNPFFVTEVLAAGEEAIPRSVRDAVLARAARSSPEAQALLEAVAVTPPQVELWLLDALAGDAVGALEECLAAGMLAESSNAVAFRHELARIAIEESVEPRRRLALHARALEALSSPPSSEPDPARLAHHAEAAGDRAAVLEHAPAAARQAAALGAYREAASQYGRALRFADGLPPAERAALLERQSDAYYLTDDQLQAIATLEEAIDCWQRAGDQLREARAWSGLISYLTCRGRLAAAEDAGRHARDLIGGLPDSPEVARINVALALLEAYHGDSAAVTDRATRAHELATRFGDATTAAEASLRLGTVELFRGGPEPSAALESVFADAELNELPQIAANALHNLAFGSIALGASEPAAHWLDAGLAYCDTRELDLWRLALLSLRVRFELDRGCWTEATETATQIRATIRDSPEPRLTGELALALVRARRGDPDTAKPLADAATIAAGADDPFWHASVACAVAEVAWLEQRSEGVGAATDAAYAREAADVAGSWWIAELAFWRRRHGIVDELPDGLQGPWALMLAGDWHAAADAWRAAGRPYETALALAELDDEAALREAHATSRALGAGPLAALVAQRLRERGVRVSRGPRATTASNPAALTAREVEILELLAHGLRNADIAERLFLSPRTVDHHVSAILRKLRAKSRGEAVAEAARLGLLQDGRRTSPT